MENTKTNVQTYGRGMATRDVAKIAMFTAITCILGPLSIQIGPVPISFTNLAVYLSIYALGWKRGTISYLVYLLIGLIGLPVFSAFSGGVGKLFGPTGGYLIGFIFMAIVAGVIIDRFPEKYALHGLGLAVGTVVAYVFGTLWLKVQAGITLQAAIAAGVLPFIVGDLMKIVISMIIGVRLRAQLMRAKLF